MKQNNWPDTDRAKCDAPELLVDGKTEMEGGKKRGNVWSFRKQMKND